MPTMPAVSGSSVHSADAATDGASGAAVPTNGAADLLPPHHSGDHSSSTPEAEDTERSAPDHTLDQQLAALPPQLALYFRDLLRGLEAEAGDARAEVREVRAALESDIARLRLHAAGLQGRVDELQAECDRLRAAGHGAGASLARRAAGVARRALR
ncbi:hypothetical protein [Nakamurella aerolata]|uniref:Uncharacterized protein n=1 Tax=Nakamurella aerolata TaxID=1656892 RepID=A0A849A9J9_9ACTN|nr:hypothetical protein [Nakamurella aerolata]NNG36286.1 hypothetical protein [Nakamurella aerolata]